MPTPIILTPDILLSDPLIMIRAAMNIRFIITNIFLRYYNVIITKQMVCTSGAWDASIEKVLWFCGINYTITDNANAIYH